MNKPREFWVFKGDSNFCQELEYDYESDSMRKAKSCGFYDIVSTKDTVEGGIHVREVRAGETTRIAELEAEVAKYRAALEKIADGGECSACSCSCHERAREALK